MKYHTLFFQKLGKVSQILSSAAVVIGALRVNHFHYVYLQTGTLANREHLDDMLHKAAFHQGLHCLPR